MATGGTNFTDAQKVNDALSKRRKRRKRLKLGKYKSGGSLGKYKSNDSVGEYRPPAYKPGDKPPGTAY